MKNRSMPRSMQSARGTGILPVIRHGQDGHGTFGSMVSMAIVLVVVMLGAVSCQKSSTGGGILSKVTESISGQPPEIDAGNGVSFRAGKSFAQVVLKPGVKLMEKAAVDASIQGIGTDGHGVVFKNAPPEILALKAGDLLIVKNAFAAKVLAAETVGDQTVLVTDRVGLADVVQQGEVNVDVPISFHGSRAANTPPLSPPPFKLMDLLETSLYAQGMSGGSTAPPSPNTISKATDLLTSGWKIESWSVKPAGNNAALSARMTKDTGGFKAAVEMDGTITDFQFVTNLKFPPTGGQLQAAIQGMSGHMHFVWEIGKGTPGVWAEEDKIKLPAGITIPLGPIFAGVPLAIDISSAFLVHPALTGGNEYSKGGFTIDWVGKNSAQSTAIDIGAADGSEGLTFAITDDANVSPLAPNGMVIAFCAPRIELQLSPLGAYGGAVGTGFKMAAAVVDAAISYLANKYLPPDVLSVLKSSPLGKMSVSNILSSKADVFVQIIHTEGVTHSSNITLAPCTKIELKVSGQKGGEAQLFGLTKGASTTKDIFTKTYTEWRPGSKFCKSI